MSNNQLVPTTPIVPAVPGPLASAGQAANRAAISHIFANYRQRRSPRTLRNQRAALVLWVQFLDRAQAARPLVESAMTWAQGGGVAVEAMDQLREYAEQQDAPLPAVLAGHYCQHDPEAWRGVTWGLVEAFVQWMMSEGYTVSTINNRLSAVRVYARLASKAGVIPHEELSMIREVRGYSETEGKRVNENRRKRRVGHKKAESVVLTVEQAQRLKYDHEDTPQGKRDRLLMCLLLDLGIRASEAAGLRVQDIEGANLRVYRPKTDRTDVLAMTPDILEALADYRPFLRESGRVLRGSLKNKKLSRTNMSVRAIGARVKMLGRGVLGIWELSPHDLRHTWATHAAKRSNPFALRDAGGWTNMQTPGRYVERGKVANEQIKLDY